MSNKQEVDPKHMIASLKNTIGNQAVAIAERDSIIHSLHAQLKEKEQPIK